MGTFIDGLIEARTVGGAWKIEVSLLDFDLGKARDAGECLFGHGGAIGVERGPCSTGGAVRRTPAARCRRSTTS